MAQDMKTLIRNRGSIKQKITILENYISSIQDETNSVDICNIQSRYENCKDLINQFETIQTEIEEKCEEKDLISQFSERNAFESKYFTSISFLKDILNKNSPIQSNVPVHDSLQNILLPKLKLPVFNGEYETWLDFKQSFMSTIDQNTTLNQSQKYNFLKATLDGYAKRAISGCEETQDYPRAWKMLCDKFDKRKCLVDTHIQSVINITPLHKNTFLQFRHLLDEVSIHLSALENKINQHKWKEFHTKTELPTLNEFLDFLKERQDILQSQQEVNVKPQFNQFSKASNQFYKTKDAQMHSHNTCNLGSCKKCGRKHNTFLHNDVTNQQNNNSNEPLVFNNSSSQPSTSSSYNNAGNQTSQQSTVLFQTNPSSINIKEGIINASILLSTVTFKVRDSSGKFQVGRALLDSGAQSNLVTEAFCKKIGVPLSSANLSIIGINQVMSTLTKKTSLTIFSNVSNFQCNVCCYVTPMISSSIPSEKVNVTNIKIPDNIKLSDPLFYSPNEIDMLIGVTLFWDLILDGKITIGKNKPIFQNTKLGWIVSGAINNSGNYSICNFSKDIVIPEDHQLKKFWELNELDNSIEMSTDELHCEELFHNDTSRHENGQFIVKFPLRSSPTLLGDSKEKAIQRFLSLEKRFKSNTIFYNLYKQFIQDYIQLGHMTKISVDNLTSSHYYLPHHAVLKETSITSKIRVVFDGSCTTSSGWSLNDLQYMGPKVLNNIFDITLRFRLYKYVVSADVSKMYRQILMHSDHRPLQCIIWRNKSEDDLSSYQLNTVTYGTKSAPYLAIKCLNQVATEYKNIFPIASKTIHNDFYVDDLLTGSNNIEELQTRCNDISSILKSANFILRKWVSNNSAVLEKVELTDIPNKVLDIGESESFKTLGTQWDSKQDILRYKITTIPLDKIVTKRQILSIIAQIYDPLGLLSPVIIISKILIQHLWSIKLPWDDPVPENVHIKWFQFYNQLSQLNTLKIPRIVIGTSHKLVDIHCFCDASLQAYASCLYMRSINSDGAYTVRLLCSKTKVSPLKSVTIPRLELCAALLGAQLTNQTINAISSTVPVYMWSDSQIVLCWIKKQPNQLQTFVSNRVAKIQNLTSNFMWSYVSTKENPADLASRGIVPELFINMNLWWMGPDFLYQSIDHLVNSNSHQIIELPELKKVNKVLTSKIMNQFTLFTTYSDLTKLQRITSYILRFIFNLRKSKSERKYGSLSVEELNYANLKLIKLAQFESFAEEIKIIEQNKSLPPKHKLSFLSPFLDEQGLLRVGGRLKFTSLEIYKHHPYLLSSTHNLTKLIFKHKHAALLHPGPQLLLASIRQFYWPIGGRSLARQTTKNCITCFKFNPSFATYPMSSLPDNRIKPSLPFQFTGIDYAGPFPLKDKAGRGCKILKCYICVFVCFSTKAIHLELVSNLTTRCFLSCLKRFTSRRGVPSDVYSDNGSTFVGARNELKEFGIFLLKNENVITQYASKDNIHWHFIPPYSPNFGGLWEAAVKSTKHFLKRTMLNRILIYENFNTLLVQIEGILNSRPLYSLSNDPNDLEPITPSHFLIGRPITMLPEPDVSEAPPTRLSRLQSVQQLYQQFWIRFTKEYISQLRFQYKWKNQATPIAVGTLVLIKNDQQPPGKWPMGRVLRLFPGKDGVSRVAEVKTSSKVVIRSVRHLCPLPIEEDTVN
ncbi:uncharacterized protein [Diabrotica undecimpunctata]|uniref:uncharacterized protein n=1 Tax=Diabrotica undecimpunctata TaxID=50387 RepID=UPI003B63D1DF